MTQREKKFAYVLAPAVLILVWRVCVLIARFTPQAAQAAPSIDTSPAAPIAQPNAKPATPARSSIYANDPRVMRQAALTSQTWSRDPFYSPKLLRAPEPLRPAAPVNMTPPPPWPLTGLSRCGNKRAAILAGRIVTEGTLLEGDYSVIEIASDSVLIRQGDREFRYRIGQPPSEVRLKRGSP